MNIKSNLSLIFGISIPILMIIFVALSIYLPQFFVKPQYDFLYLIGNNNCYIDKNNSTVYSVQNNRIVQNVQDEVIQNCMMGQLPELKIFLYDMEKNRQEEISFQQASNLELDQDPQSPDGFEIVYGNNDGGGFFPFFFFSGSDYNSHYIKGHNVSKKLNIQQSGYSYSRNFIFLGWVKK